LIAYFLLSKPWVYDNHFQFSWSAAWEFYYGNMFQNQSNLISSLYLLVTCFDQSTSCVCGCFFFLFFWWGFLPWCGLDLWPSPMRGIRECVWTYTFANGIYIEIHAPTSNTFWFNWAFSNLDWIRFKLYPFVAHWSNLQVQMYRFGWKWNYHTQRNAVFLWGTTAPHGVYGSGTCTFWRYFVSDGWYDWTRGYLVHMLHFIDWFSC